MFDYRSARRRPSPTASGVDEADDADATAQPRAGRLSATVAAVVVGVVAWTVFAFWAHGAWIGVRPFG